MTPHHTHVLQFKNWSMHNTFICIYKCLSRLKGKEGEGGVLPFGLEIGDKMGSVERHLQEVGWIDGTWALGLNVNLGFCFDRFVELIPVPPPPSNGYFAVQFSLGFNSTARHNLRSLPLSLVRSIAFVSLQDKWSGLAVSHASGECHVTYLPLMLI